MKIVNPMPPHARFCPDGSTVTRVPPSCNIELLPKEVKTANKWSSGLLGDLLQSDGQWKPNTFASPSILPIRQLFTYCLLSKCRYGLVLTTHEAVVCRISLQTPIGDLPAIGDTPGSNYVNGSTMEWRSFQWDDDLRNSNDMSMNQAIYFLHILAGNGHSIESSYPLLAEQPARFQFGMPMPLVVPPRPTFQFHSIQAQPVPPAPTASSASASVPVGFSRWEGLRSQTRKRQNDDDHDGSPADGYVPSPPAVPSAEQSQASRGPRAKMQRRR